MPLLKYLNLKTVALEILSSTVMYLMHVKEGLDGGGGGGGGRVSNSLISKNLAHYSLSLKFLLIL